MKRKHKLLLLFVAVISIFAYYHFTSPQFNEGELYVGPVTSPTGAYTANSYYETYGGAAGGVNIWVEITYHHESNKTNAIYYGPGRTGFDMEWVNEHTIYIENRSGTEFSEQKTIDVRTGKEVNEQS
ncbi:DUF5412 family protein [Bacillus solimangrovi]|uniref:Uncharacterized protein n=1 Tax=Bacillus solimangrovi TaxID=1305675 RepID=A0A1E5LG49_9BACI|nr:DUF5412 family protein [Bacillus solimangrovi]OEH93058.1 hypothetical protein BFG57_13975 [Bacillus solimangrovi]